MATFSEDESRLLILLINNNRSVISLRSNLGWPVAKFAKTIHSLSEKNIISYSNLKIEIVAQSELILDSLRRQNIKSCPNDYVEKISIQALDPKEVYLPDYKKFLRAMSKSY
jgi:predicted transcriptional regulator